MQSRDDMMEELYEQMESEGLSREEADAFVVHAEPTKRDVFVGKRWVASVDLPSSQRERSLSPLRAPLTPASASRRSR